MAKYTTVGGSLRITTNRQILHRDKMATPPKNWEREFNDDKKENKSKEKLIFRNVGGRVVPIRVK
jgi:hypothetical protein